MNVLKKIENSKMIKNPKFLVIGLIAIILVIALIYFIFLKYSPIMNFKYEGYAISGKEITENLLSSSEDSSTSGANTNATKNLELTKIEEQGTIFKKLNEYFVGNKEKTKINLNYPIYINGNSAIYNLAETSTLITKNFEELAGYPNLSISEGKIYNGNDLERADGKEYIFVKTTDEVYINLAELKIKTTANEYTIPVNSILAFTENSIRYYTANNNILIFNEINDIDNNSNVQIVENSYTYEELLTKLRILQDENNTEAEQEEQSNIIKEDSTEQNNSTNENDITEETNENTTEDETEEGQASYIKPQVSAEDFTAEVYTAKSTLTIKDPTARIVEAPTFELYKDGRMYLRRTFSNSGEIQLTGLIPETEYEVIGKFIYLNEKDQQVENTFYEGKFTTKGYEELGSIDLTKENGEIYSNKIQITKVKITSDLNAEVIKGVNQVEIETGEIRTVLKNNQVTELLQGKELTIESSEGLKSNSKIKYAIKFYDKNGIELKVTNNEGETRTSKEAPTVKVSIKEQNIVSVTLRLKLINKDNVELENYKYIVTRPNGDIVKEEKLAKNEKELVLEDLDQNQYYKIGIYADYDLNDNRGKQENVELGNLVFATQPIATLGSLELIVENKELTSTTSTISYKIDEGRTDKRLIQILNELTINIKNGDNIVKTDTLTGDEIKNLQQAGTKEIKYEDLKSNTTYTIEITGNIQLGNTQENVPVTYNYKEFTTLKIPAKVEIKNQFGTGSLIDFDVRIADINNSVLNNKVRMELRNSSNDLLDIQELTTNEDFIRKTYEKLEENQIYKLSFYADQYNEGSTDATYKVNYLIKEIEIKTEPGISGSIGLTELSKKATGKNLVDMNSETKWYVYPNFNTGNYYGKEYNTETKTLTLGGHNNHRVAVYDLREYAGQEVTMSFKAKAVSGSQTAYIQNSKMNTNKTQLKGLTAEWKDFEYTLTVDSTGYLGFYIQGGNGIQVKELQIELGDKKTKYEEFKYTLQSTYSINLADQRDEITTNDYYIKIYEDGKLIKTDRYEEIPEENVITNAIKTYEAQPNKQYKVELAIKIKDREYVLSELEYNTQETEEIKGIYNKEDFLELQPRGHYIVLGDIDLSGGISMQYRFGSTNLPFEGTIDFNGYTLTRSASSRDPIFSKLDEKAVIKNLNLNIKLDNELEISSFVGFCTENYGKLENIMINLTEATNVPNNRIFLLTYYNYGIVDKFILNFEEPIYGSFLLTGVANTNYGIISNGYCYGNNIQAIYNNTSNTARYVAPIAQTNSNQGKIYNVYSLVSVDTEGATGKNSETANIVGANREGASVENVYSVGLGDTYDLAYGPNVYIVSNEQVNNSYYFNEQIFNNAYNRKNTELALYDTVFQNQLINSEEKFDVDNLIEKGYYPWLKMPTCMPMQKYIELPEVEDKDLPDILSMEIVESNNKDEARVKLYINNPGGETITNIEIKNLDCQIESQTYKDGKSEVIALINNPSLYVSEYSVLSISTKGVFNSEYTREFKENERLIKIDFFKEINSIQEWNDINKSPTENYILMTDLDFKNNPTLARITVVYKGILDGNNHTIKNINLNESYVINQIRNELKNITFENCKLSCVNVQGIISYSYGKMENVKAKNVDLEITSNVTTPNIGGLVGVATDGASLINCSISNVSIKINTYTTTTRAGGLIGVANRVEVSNCFAQNININIKNNTYEGVGGLIGASEQNGIIKNCYATGKIDADGGNIGGLVGFCNYEVKIENSYSYVNISGAGEIIGGIAGYTGTNIYLTNNLAIGDLYTSAKKFVVNRITQNGNNLSNNYAFADQRINGKKEEVTREPVTLISAEELQNKNTYIEKLRWANIYNYDGVEQAILPKLNQKDSMDIMPYQNDIYLNLSNKFSLYSINAEKIAVDKIQGQVAVTNINNLEVSGLEIDGIQIDIKNIVTRDGITYINFEGSPTKFYDVYKLTYILYKENENSKKEEIEGRIDIQFYKEIYTFEDWQGMESGTYQNYRIMQDIDFAGKNNVNSGITALRIEGVDEDITLKNINVPTNNSLINAVKIELKNLKFENINIEYTEKTQNIGIISNLKGNMENSSFKDITIDATGSDKVGIIGASIGSIKNIKLDNISVSAGSRVGGLVGESAGAIDNVTAQKVNITAKDEIGGIVGYTTANVTNISIDDANIKGNNYVGGIIGSVPSQAQSIGGFIVQNSSITGNSYVGGIEGYIYGFGSGVRKIYNSHISGTGDKIGGVAGSSDGSGRNNLEVIACTIEGIGVNSNYVGGFSGIGAGTFSNCYIKDSKIETTGSYVGGFMGETGSSSNTTTLVYNYAENIEVLGYSKVGGMSGNLNKAMRIHENYINAKVSAIGNEAGGILGYLNNTDMTAASNTSRLYNNYFVGSVEGKSNVGGAIGNIATDLYMPENYYYGNYIEAYINSEDENTVSLGIGGRDDQNQYLKDTYYYKYSAINGEAPNEQNEVFIPQENYLIEEDLKQQATYTSKLKWTTSDWNFTVLENNKYPTINSTALLNQEGIDIPKDSEHDLAGVASSIQQGTPEQTFEYDGKQITTYSDYSIIQDELGNTVKRTAKLYFKEGNLYVISPNMDMVEGNFILDTYNGKEYETVLGTDGKIYDLKEKLTYPKNFENKDIKSIGNNLNTAEKEVEVTYNNGDKIKFNYQTGAIISEEKLAENKIGLIEFIQDKLNTKEDAIVTNEQEYEDTKGLIQKLEEVPIEKAEKIQNNTEEQSNETENQNKNITKYVSTYNASTDSYDIYNEEELLNTTKQNLETENEKIAKKNLSSFYSVQISKTAEQSGKNVIYIIILAVVIVLAILIRYNINKNKKTKK